MMIASVVSPSSQRFLTRNRKSRISDGGDSQKIAFSKGFAKVALGVERIANTSAIIRKTDSKSAFVFPPGDRVNFNIEDIVIFYFPVKS